MKDSHRNISNVAIATFASRVLGLLRDMLFFATLGTGAVNSAFILAFTLPNLFRRLLGEGALTSAVIPVFSESLEESGRAGAFRLLNAVLTRLILALGAVFLLLVAGGLAIQLFSGLSPRYYLGGELTALLAPYVIFVCFAALVSAGLNVLNRFVIPALSQVWLNLAMILSLVAGSVLTEDPVARAFILSGGVLLGGCLQLIIACAALAREGWRPSVEREKSEALGLVFKLLVPGLMGAAIFQVNTLVSRLLAFGLDEAAAGILYLANRLVELPLGVFAVAIATVIFPELSRKIAQRDETGFAHTISHGYRLILIITLPAAAGLWVLAEPILVFLFQWGAYGSSDVAQTRLPLQIFAIGIPFFALSTIATRGFHARKNMRTPVRMAAVNFGANLVFSLALMFPFGTPGLAAANVLAGALHSSWMLYLLRGRILPESRQRETSFTLRVVTASLLMAAIVYLFAAGLSQVTWAAKLRASAIVVGGIPLGIGCYALFLRLLGVREFASILKSFGSRSRRNEAGASGGGLEL